MKLSNCDLIIILVLIIVVLAVYYLYLISENLEQFQVTIATTATKKATKATKKATKKEDILKELYDLCGKVTTKPTGATGNTKPTGATGNTKPTGATATTLIDPLDPFSSFSPVTTTTL